MHAFPCCCLDAVMHAASCMPSPPIPPSPQARAVVAAELGAPVEELFSEFSAEPIAAASLAQVRAGQTARCDVGA